MVPVNRLVFRLTTSLFVIGAMMSLLATCFPNAKNKASHNIDMSNDEYDDYLHQLIEKGDHVLEKAVEKISDDELLDLVLRLLTLHQRSSSMQVIPNMVFNLNMI